MNLLGSLWSITVSFIECNPHSSCHLSQTQTSLAMEVDVDPSWGLHRSLYSEEEIGKDYGHWDWNPQLGTFE